MNTKHTDTMTSTECIELQWPDNIVAERHEVSGKWVIHYATDEQAAKCAAAMNSRALVNTAQPSATYQDGYRACRDAAKAVCEEIEAKFIAQAIKCGTDDDFRRAGGAAFCAMEVQHLPIPGELPNPENQ